VTCALLGLFGLLVVLWISLFGFFIFEAIAKKSIPAPENLFALKKDTFSLVHVNLRYD
jgi:hypothetical protein